MAGGTVMTLIAPTLQAFFTDRLVQQRQASPQTVASYRDTMRVLLTFVHQQTGKTPAQLDWDDLDATTISAFLNHLEDERRNSTRTRNLRLTAIRSLFSYAALRHPEHALLIQRVLAIPPKRFDKRIVTFLTAAEVDALLAAPDPGRWEGRRDRALMLLAIQSGLRVSELTSLNCGDITLGTGASVRCEGKGRKQRAVPLTGRAETLLRLWLRERAGQPGDPLFPTWFAPASLEVAMSANCLQVYQKPVPYNRFSHTLSEAYLRSMSEAVPRYTTAPSPSWQSSHHRLPASPS